ncbi:MAG: VanZ family protein [Propionibacteriaceae bacterium]
MPALGHRFGVPQLLVVLAAGAVAVHLFGLYRPTGPPSPSWFPHIDKAEHLIGFGAPVCLVLLARWRWRRRSGQDLTRRFTGLVVGAFALHALVSEVAQHFFYVHRTGDVLDVLADWTGVALGWAVAWGIRRSAQGRAGRAAATAQAT